MNRGVPVPMSAPRSSVSKAIADVAEALLPPQSSKGRRPVEADAPAPLEIGDGKRAQAAPEHSLQDAKGGVGA